MAAPGGFIELSDETGMPVLVARGEIAMVREMQVSIGQVRSTIVLKSGGMIGLTTQFAAVVKRLSHKSQKPTD